MKDFFPIQNFSKDFNNHWNLKAKEKKHNIRPSSAEKAYLKSIYAFKIFFTIMIRQLFFT